MDKLELTLDEIGIIEDFIYNCRDNNIIDPLESLKLLNHLDDCVTKTQ